MKIFNYWGIIYILGIPLLSYFRIIGIEFNITLVITLTSCAIFLLGSFFSKFSSEKMYLMKLNSISDLSLILFSLYTFFNFLVFYTIVDSNITLEQIFHLLALSFLCPLSYYFGLNFSAFVNEKATNTFFNILVFLTILFLGIRLSAIFPDTSDIGIQGSYYQYSADTLALTFLFFQNKSHKRHLILACLITFILLILIGSRATLLAFVVAMFSSKLYKYIIVFSICIFLFFTQIGNSLEENDEILTYSRTISTFYLYFYSDREDLSHSERDDLTEATWVQISSNPIWGDILYDTKISGFYGGYAHSALDLWARYGIFLFIVFIFILFGNFFLIGLSKRSLLYFIKIFYKNNIYPLLVFILMELTFFRHPESIILFFGMGYLSAQVIVILRVSKKKYFQLDVRPNMSVQ